MFVPDSDACNAPNSAQPITARESGNFYGALKRTDDLMETARKAYQSGLVRSPFDFKDLGLNFMSDVQRENSRGAGATAAWAGGKLISEGAPKQEASETCAVGVEVLPLDHTLPGRRDYPMRTDQAPRVPKVPNGNGKVGMGDAYPIGGAYSVSCMPVNQPAGSGFNWWWLVGAGVLLFAAGTGTTGTATRKRRAA